MDAVIVSTARTPLCKSWKGALNMTHGATMGGHVVKAALERAQLDPAEVEDVIMGCATPEGATGQNIARQIAIRYHIQSVPTLLVFQEGRPVDTITGVPPRFTLRDRIEKHVL